MNQFHFMILRVFVCLLIGHALIVSCENGGDTSSTSQAPQGSCMATSNQFCINYINIPGGSSGAKDVCEAGGSGTYSTGACTENDMVKSCSTNTAGSEQIYIFYSSASQALINLYCP